MTARVPEPASRQMIGIAARSHARRRVLVRRAISAARSPTPLINTSSSSTPLANSLFRRPAVQTPNPMSKIEAAYHKAECSMEQVIQLLAA